MDHLRKDALEVLLAHEVPVFPLYRNQSIDLLCKLIDWFLYEGNTITMGYYNICVLCSVSTFNYFQSIYHKITTSNNFESGTEPAKVASCNLFKELEKRSNILKTLAVLENVRFLKYVQPFFKITHEKVSCSRYD